MAVTQGGRLIYQRDNNPAIWLVVLGPFLGVMSQALVDGDNLLEALPLALALAAVGAGGLWFVFAHLAETQLARVERAGDQLLVQHVDLFGRGRTARISIASIGNWRVVRRNPRSGNTQAYALGFNADGRPYTVPIKGARVMDKDAWWDLSRISF